MDGWQRLLAAIDLLILGKFALVGGTALTVTKALEVLTAFLLSLWPAGPSLLDLEPRPVLPFDFFWPALTILAGVLVLLLGWVIIIRGATLDWPRRFDRSAQDGSGRIPPETAAVSTSATARLQPRMTAPARRHHQDNKVRLPLDAASRLVDRHAPDDHDQGHTDAHEHLLPERAERDPAAAP